MHLLVLDFSKAFDTVRHAALASKLENIPLHDSIYNWIVNYLGSRMHCTKSNNIISSPLATKASVIQGSALSPIGFIITASDLKATVQENKMLKYADDTYLIVPATNINTITEEMDNIESWSKLNNLCLNRAKLTQMIISRNKRSVVIEPSRTPGIERVNT